MQRCSVVVVRFITGTLNFWTQLTRDMLHVMIMINRTNIYSYKTEVSTHIPFNCASFLHLPGDIDTLGVLILVGYGFL